MKTKSVAKSGAKKRVYKPRVPRRVLRSKYNVPEQASLTETIAWGSTGKCSTNTNYKLNNVSLSQTIRARVVAQGYQMFRITGVTLRFKPQQDTFLQQSLVANAASVPYLYCMIDRTGRIGNDGMSPEILRRLGAKPRRLDDKTLTFTYKPNVLTQTFDNTPAAGLNAQYKISPWLNCRDDTTTLTWNPSTIDHFGMVFVAEQQQGAPINFQVEYEVQFEFKKPSVLVLSGDTDPVYSPEDEVPPPPELLKEPSV